MESPGEYLKRERELRGVTLSKVQEATRIQRRYLEAIEGDDYSNLPHPTFVKGFIKSYCRFLGLDEQDAVLRYEVFIKDRAEREGVKPQAEPAAIRGDIEAGEGVAGKNIAYLVAAGIAVIAIFYAATYLRSPKEERVAKEEPVGEVQAPQATSLEPVQPSEPQAVTPQMAEAQKKAAAELKEKKPEAGKVALPVTAPQQAVAPRQAPAPATAPSTLTQGQAQPAGVEARAGSPAQALDLRHSLTVSASELSWVKVKIDDNDPFDVTLKEGEGITWKAKDGFVVVVGNAGGVALTFDGKKLPLLGKSGEVVRLELSSSFTRALTVVPEKPISPDIGETGVQGTTNGNGGGPQETPKDAPANGGAKPRTEQTNP